MAVTHHNTQSTAGPVAAATRQITYTSTAGACLLVWLHTNTATSISAVGADVTQFTRLGHISSSASRSELWGLSSAPGGILHISADVVGAAAILQSMVVTGYVGQKQFGGSPFGTVVAGTATAANAAFSVSSTTADLVAFGFGLSANTTITLTTGTSRADVTHSTTGRLVVGDITGAATISISATAASSGVWSFLAVPIVASAAPTTSSLHFDNAAVTSTTTLAGSIGMLLTATSNAVLLVFTNISNGTQSISAVQAGTNQLGRLGFVQFRNASSRMEVWGLTAPPSGVLTISAAVVGGNVEWGLAAITYTGHKTTATPFGGVVGGSGSSTAVAAVSISSNAGNLAVYCFGTGGLFASAMDVVVGVQRTHTLGNWESMAVGEAPGDNGTVTAQAICDGLIHFGALGINLIQSGVGSTVTATFTDVADTFSASAHIIVVSRLSATDVVDKFSASAFVRVAARLSATDTGIDTLAGTASVRVTARLSATDATDTFSASAHTIVTARLSATDAADIFSASASIRVTSRLSATDARDTFASTALVRDTAFLSATDTRDTFAGTAAVRVTAFLAATDTPDIFSASVTTANTVGTVTAYLSATDATDTFSASATVVPVSSAAVVTTFIDPGAGGGHKKKPPYIPLTDDFWDARERYLKSIFEEMEEPEPLPIPPLPPTAVVPPTYTFAPQLLIDFRAERAQTIEALPSATTMRQLRIHGDRLRKLNQSIAEQKHLQLLHEQAVAAKAKADRRLRRAKLRRAIKKQVVLIAALETARFLYTKRLL